MENDLKKPERARDMLATYWPIAAGLLAIAVSWGANSFQLGNLQDGNKALLARFDRQDEKIDRLTDKVGGYQASAASMQATQLAAGAALVELQNRVHEVELRGIRR